MKHLIIILVTAVIASCSLLQNTTNSNKELSIGFYNVENLFDTIDDPHTNDNEFLPASKKAWNTKRLTIKMQKLDSVLMIMTPIGAPDLLGVCEVENKLVCTNWQQQGVLKNHTLVHRESPDQRGIDVALFYNPQKMQLLNASWHQLLQDDQEKSSTREILYTKLLANKDTLHVFVNHWPSRYGGEEASRPKRVKAAQLLRNIVDSIQAKQANANIVIMGDFNDYPTNASLVTTLIADSVMNGTSSLFNLSYEAHKNGLGSYNYRGEWGCLDQMIASKSLIHNRKGYHASTSAYQIIQQPFMMYVNKKGEASPSRTYGGSNYFGGFSDHLPVTITLTR
jgi:predicted extracellular nuclease